MMKKVLAALALLSVCTLALCACGNQEPEVQETAPDTAVVATTEAVTVAISKDRVKALCAEMVKNVIDEYPEFALYDFDKDGTPELLFWAPREGTAMDRSITVYQYDPTTDELVNVGTMMDFAGHSNVGISPEDDGIVIATRDNRMDTITKYTLENGVFSTKVLLTRTNESPSEWVTIMESSQYFKEENIPVYGEVSDLDPFFN